MYLLPKLASDQSLSLICPKKTLHDIAQCVLLLSVAQGNLNAGESVITVEGHDITLPGHHRKFWQTESMSFGQLGTQGRTIRFGPRVK